ERVIQDVDVGGRQGRPSLRDRRLPEHARADSAASHSEQTAARESCFRPRVRLRKGAVTVDRSEELVEVRETVHHCVLIPSSRKLRATCSAVIGVSTASGAATSPAIARTQAAWRASTETIVAAAERV